MRLKTLELRGFKSFADKTVINFGEDVIGVVGSNGCGKSNIVDAIRWVLGEQKTKHLRSESMTNVIFNGTKGRKSAGFAEVVLIFENNKGILPTAYREVSIHRILYKDGSSEYRLNDVKCRLKDINNLISDTGMGPDSYAIIALGMVDDLLRDKENARLRLFEQAAGISKYKGRKKETLLKLKNTEADLTRVEDLLFEIEKNLKSLERQAKRAQKYLELKKEYKELSLEHTYILLADYKVEYQDIEEKIAKEEKQQKELKGSVVRMEELVEKEKSIANKKERELSEVRRDLNRLVGKIKGKENDQRLLGQKQLFIQQNSEKLDSRLNQAQERIGQINRQLEQYKDQETTEKKVLSILGEELHAAKDFLETVRVQYNNLKKDLGVYEQEQKKINQQLFGIEKRVAILKNQEQNNKQQLERAATQLQMRQNEVAGVQQQLEELNSQKEEKDTQIATLKQQEQERQEALKDAEKTLETTKDELNGENRKLDAKRNEYRLLKNMVERMEGFPESIKFLAKNRSWSGTAPLLSDIFYCPPAYRTAVENYLEPYLSYYVVENMQEAMQAIYLLDQHKKGKCNFFILDKLKGQTASKPKFGSGVAALDVLEIDDKYKTLAEQLLGTVEIVDQLPSQTDNGTVYITKDGRFTQTAYAMRGGSVGAFEGKKIGRRKNLEFLEKEQTTLYNKVQELMKKRSQEQQTVQSLKQKNFQNQIRRIEQELNTLVRSVITTKAKLENFEHFKKELQSNQKNIQTQLDQFALERADLDKKWQVEQETKIAVEEKYQACETKYKEIAEQLSQKSSVYNQKHIEQVRQQNKLNSIEKELAFCVQQKQELDKQMQQDNTVLSGSDKDMEDTAAKIEETKKVLDEWYSEKKNLQKNLEAAEKAYFEARGNIRAQEDALKQNNKQYQQNIQLVHQLENKFNQLKLQLNSLAERLKIEFEIDINTILEKEADETLDIKTLEEKIAKLRKRLANYGSVNPMAIEAYNEIKERNDFIVKERKDLLESQAVLKETMFEIESKATNKFMQAFTQVRGHFVRVFRSLFEADDTCDLKLSDPEKPLESRIEIIAKPKGKRPLSINQLSGGEKTLTATALLFSLYLLKPAPFCIFDEVDAPLDDANIAKFNNIIKDFSKNSQFIIVTHNKKTMEAVDIMYGVTMVKGVSKVVPVDFRNLQAVTLN
ncbi:MAG: chromosome segregation protein SMC [Saprospiraceae bacterium]|nr:chromosome segregation protein SMC [Saprospiraceae bacterium]